MKSFSFGLLLLLFRSALSQGPLIASFLDASRRALNIPQGATSDTDIFKKSYDFIVVGAGSGGSVVTNRLTENSSWDVLLLEAGKEEIWITEIPLMVSYLLGTDYNWGYRTQPQNDSCLAMKQKRCCWPRGKAMGGTSVINYMVYTRGFQRDYDNWASLGNPGWAYKEIFPYFTKFENMTVPSLKHSGYYGTGGYLDVERPEWRTPLADCFLKSGGEAGYPVGDSEGLTPHGFSYVLSTTRNGARLSASKAFLRPIRDRRNLFVSKRSRVTKILFNNNRAYGVEFVKNRKRYTVLAKKEIILSAGALNSPQILMLSGVGPKEHLSQLGIPLVKNLRVGDNLQDHVSMAGLAFLINDTVGIVEERFRSPWYLLDYLLNGKGPLSLPGGSEAFAFLSTKHNQDPSHPDMELVFGPGSFIADTGGSLRESFGMNDTFYERVYKRYSGADSFSIVPVLLKPRSRGRVRLRSKNPFHWPLLYPNYYSDKRDLDVMVEGIKMAVAIGEGKSFKKYNSRLLERPFAGCEKLKFRSDKYWACAARQLTTNLHHQVGTCKMGPSWDPTAVVDHELKVHGITGLRVVDASVMPVIPAAHTNAVIFMIGEKASDLIKKTWRPSY